jgi:hypothetical protein
MATIGKQKTIKDVILETTLDKTIDIDMRRFASFKATVIAVNKDLEPKDKVSFKYIDGKPGFMIATRVETILKQS